MSNAVRQELYHDRCLIWIYLGDHNIFMLHRVITWENDHEHPYGTHLGGNTRSSLLRPNTVDLSLYPACSTLFDPVA